MDWLEALILGIIQGLTEYLPVSSSGHIELGKHFMGIEIEDNVTFSVILHFGTVLSTLVVFRKDIAEIIAGLFKPKESDAWSFSSKIVLSMIPAGVLGFLFNDEMEILFDGNILLVGIMLFVTGGLLYAAQVMKGGNRPVGWGSSILIGFAQMVALLPGVSRSGATISTALLLKIDREKAARFSFLMVIPLILGKVAKDFLDGAFAIEGDQLMVLGIGFVASFIVGILACQWMLRIVKNSQLTYFAAYCWIVGSIAVLAHLLG